MTKINKTFEEWLQEFSSDLYIMEHPTNPDIDVLYRGEKRLCSVPKGLKKGLYTWDKISDKRHDDGYKTSLGIAHRSLSGIGTVLMSEGIINIQQFIKHFLTKRNREVLEKIQEEAIKKGHLEVASKNGIKQIIK